MSDWFRLTLAILACWRVTRLITRENGPWNVIARVRTWAGESMIGALMDCPYCTSVWVAMPAAPFVIPSAASAPLTAVAAWLAVSGATCLLFDLNGSPEGIDHVQL